ncbi:hypothetical protein Pfo_021452 [Paulownia fortunei]|nr:hypothetical protein Pfo_021452 [Paulownia fortunei]
MLILHPWFKLNSDRASKGNLVWQGTPKNPYFRLGVRSLVLESSNSLRVTGLTLWTNGWRALVAVAIGDILRGKSVRILGSKLEVKIYHKLGKLEVRCVRRKDLLEILERELPQGTITYCSKVDSIEESGSFKLIHLAEGSVVRAKVLIGCDGVNSKVARWLALQSPVSTGRSSIRALVDYPYGHGFERKIHTYFGGGLRCGFIPCDDRSIYCSICSAPGRVLDFVERTELDCISYAPLKFRLPWNILLGNIVKDNVCVAGDALHPMPPDISHGGCSALEDGAILARCLAEALDLKMEKGLKKYSQERRWRSFSLISTAYVVGLIQGSDGKVMSFLRKRFLSRFTLGTMVRLADFDCGKFVFS